MRPERLAEWTPDQVRCRSYGHLWRPFVVTHDARAHSYRVVQQCWSCETQRCIDMTERGLYKGHWAYVYAEGYLTKGEGRLTPNDKGEIRLASLDNLNVQEVEE